MTSPFSFTNLLASATLAVSLAGTGFAQSLPTDLSERVLAAVDNEAEGLVAFFKDLHQNPELGFMEVRTAGLFADELEALGYEVKTGIGGTGVVGIMENGDGPTVLWRADMDAVPVEEATGLDYASTVRAVNLDGVEVPVGHLCGHDAHVTWALGLAKVMAELKDEWSGTLIVLGQPAEELLIGAQTMVDDGLFTDHGVPVPDYGLGMHTAPFPTGTLIGASGEIQAGAEVINVTFHGVGGHGSSPQFTKDPILMASYAIAQYQAIISRVLDPRDTGVITVGAIEAGITNNVIPESATLKLNTRYFSDDVREQLFDGIVSVSNGIARTYGMPEDQLPTITRAGAALPNINDQEAVERTNEAVLSAGLVDETSLVTELRPVTGSEDFYNLFINQPTVKTAYKFLGTAPRPLFEEAQAAGLGVPFSNHQPTYFVELSAIPLGAKIGAVQVMGLLQK